MWWKYQWVNNLQYEKPSQMRQREIRILLTGCGAPGTPGTINMLQTGAARDGVPLLIYGVDTKEKAPVVVGLEKSFTVPVPLSEAYIYELNQIIEENSIDLVLPQTTAESSMLSSKRDLVQAAVSTIDEGSFRMLNDKLKLLQAFHAANLPHPKFHMADTPDTLREAVLDLGYPAQEVVVKVPVSSGMRGVRLLSIERESGTDFRRNKPNSWRVNLEDFLETLSTEEWTPLVVMEFLSGPEYSVDVYKREEKTIILPRVRDEMRAGISMATTLDFNEEIVSQTDAFLDHYEIEGLLGFQYILTKNGPRILECNPRIQGTMVASRLTGINLAWLEAKWQLRLPFENEDFIQNSVNGTFRRSWGGVLYFADGKIETF